MYILILTLILNGDITTNTQRINHETKCESIGQDWTKRMQELGATAVYKCYRD